MLRQGPTRCHPCAFGDIGATRTKEKTLAPVEMERGEGT